MDFRFLSIAGCDSTNHLVCSPFIPSVESSCSRCRSDATLKLQSFAATRNISLEITYFVRSRSLSRFSTWRRSLTSFALDTVVGLLAVYSLLTNPLLLIALGFLVGVRSFLALFPPTPR